MNHIRGSKVFGYVALGALIGACLPIESRAQAPDTTPSIAGGWTLNKNLSDQPADPGRRGDPRDGRRGGGSEPQGGFGRGGRRGGGFGGGGFNGGADPQEAARVRDVMRDVMNPPEHLIVTDTGSMIILTGPDGRTTRLSPDGKKIKDENTKIERKTKWDGSKLVSEITGLGQNKITETYWTEPEQHQLRVAVQIDGGRSGQARTVNRVYDADAK